MLITGLCISKTNFAEFNKSLCYLRFILKLGAYKSAVYTRISLLKKGPTPSTKLRLHRNPTTDPTSQKNRQRTPQEEQFTKQRNNNRESRGYVLKESWFTGALTNSTPNWNKHKERADRWWNSKQAWNESDHDVATNPTKNTARRTIHDTTKQEIIPESRGYVLKEWWFSGALTNSTPNWNEQKERADRMRVIDHHTVSGDQTSMQVCYKSAATYETGKIELRVRKASESCSPTNLLWLLWLVVITCLSFYVQRVDEIIVMIGRTAGMLSCHRSTTTTLLARFAFQIGKPKSTFFLMTRQIFKFSCFAWKEAPTHQRMRHWDIICKSYDVCKVMMVGLDRVWFWVRLP